MRFELRVLVFAALSFASCVRGLDVPAPATLSLVAGHLGGPGSADGVGTQIRILVPRGGTVADNKLYFSDLLAIRSLDLIDHSVKTIAGTNMPRGPAADNFGTDGIGATARFDGPMAIDSDRAGGLIVADANIRLVDPATGAVTTPFPQAEQSVLAGGFLVGLASDAHGGAYFTGSATHAVYHIDLTSGAVTVFAGDGATAGATDAVGSASRFSSPGAIVLDVVRGRLLVADKGNGAIRAIDLASAQTSMIAGDAMSTTLSGPALRTKLGSLQGIAPTSAGLWLYTTTDTASALQYFDFAAATIEPADPVVPPAPGLNFGTLLGADAGNDAFLAIFSTINVSHGMDASMLFPIAGSLPSLGSADGVGAEAAFGNPYTITADDAGNLYVVEAVIGFTGVPALRKIVVATGEVTTTPLPANYWTPSSTMGPGIVFDGQGHLIMTRGGATGLYRLDLATGEGSVFADEAPTGARGDVQILATDRKGFVYLGDDALPLHRVEITTGNSVALPGAAAQLKLVTPFDSDGTTLYGSDTLDRLLAINIASGDVTVLAEGDCSGLPVDGPAANACLDNPIAGQLDGRGGLYFIDDNLVRRYDLAAATVTTVIGDPARRGVLLGPLPASLSEPFALTLRDHQLFLTDVQESSILVANVP